MGMMLGKWQSGGGRGNLRGQAEIGVKTFVVRKLERAGAASTWVSISGTWKPIGHGWGLVPTPKMPDHTW